MYRSQNHTCTCNFKKSKQSHTGSRFDNSVTLTFDFLTSGSMLAERLPCTRPICVYKFGVKISSRFPFKLRTHTDRPLLRRCNWL